MCHIVLISVVDIIGSLLYVPFPTSNFTCGCHGQFCEDPCGLLQINREQHLSFPSYTFSSAMGATLGHKEAQQELEGTKQHWGNSQSEG